MYLLEVFSILTVRSVDGGGMRPLYLVLLVLAILLLLAGSGIAIVTLRNARKDQFAVVSLDQLESEGA